MSEEQCIPLALLEGFAEVWTTLAGGSWERLKIPSGHLVLWTSPEGRRESLPDRMYGCAATRLSSQDLKAFPAGVPINLAPGAWAEGAHVHAFGHQLAAGTRDEAWSALKRVGRQGVLKAQRLGCRVLDADVASYHAIASLTAERLGGQPPHPDLVPVLRRVFGDEAVTISGVWVADQLAAAVLSVHLEGYGMLIDGSSDRQHWDKNPNNLAVWSAMGALLDSGCRRIDYGFSPPGAGDLRFKAHMGGHEVPLYRIRM